MVVSRITLVAIATAGTWLVVMLWARGKQMGGQYFGQSRKFHITRVELLPSSATRYSCGILAPVKRFSFDIYSTLHVIWIYIRIPLL